MTRDELLNLARAKVQDGIRMNNEAICRSLRSRTGIDHAVNVAIQCAADIAVEAVIDALVEAGVLPTE